MKFFLHLRFVILSTACLVALGLHAQLDRPVSSSTPLNPDPNIFDGTLVENLEEKEREPVIARVGEYQEGNSPDGRENPEGEAPREGEEGDGEQEGSGGSGEGESEEAGEQGDGQSQRGGQEGEQEGGEGGELGEMPEGGVVAESSGGGSSEQQQTDRAQAGGGGEQTMDPSQAQASARAAQAMAKGKLPDKLPPPTEASIGNNQEQVEAANVSKETLGTETEPAENASDANRAAAGKQETLEGSGSEVGDKMPADL
ncbi:MAG: hypothetical protein ACFE0O_03345 [Opitutales bacterium]